MDYVCKVVGNLEIKEINLYLYYMEIINLDSIDFKTSRRLRDALRNRELEKYNPAIHKTARRLKSMAKSQLTQTMKKETDPQLSGKFNKLNDKLDNLSKMVNKSKNVSDQIKSVHDVGDIKNLTEAISNQLASLGDKLDSALNQKIDDKLDKKLEEILEVLKEIAKKEAVFGGSSNISNLNKNKDKSYNKFDDRVTFVPKIDTSDIKTSIKTKVVESEGTDDVLEKLKELKNK